MDSASSCYVFNIEEEVVVIRNGWTPKKKEKITLRPFQAKADNQAISVDINKYVDLMPKLKGLKRLHTLTIKVKKLK